MVGIDRRSAADDVIVDAILRPRRTRWRAEQSLVVGLVVAKQQLGRGTVGSGLGRELELTHNGVLDAHVARSDLLHDRLRRSGVPRPGVAKPCRWQNMQ